MWGSIPKGWIIMENDKFCISEKMLDCRKLYSSDIHMKKWLKNEVFG